MCIQYTAIYATQPSLSSRSGPPPPRRRKGNPGRPFGQESIFAPEIYGFLHPLFTFS